MATYTVQKGDTLSAIAKRFNTTVANLMKLNGGLIKDANKLKIGWQLQTSVEPPKDVAAGPKKGPLTGKITAPEAKTGIFGSAEAAPGPAAAPQQYSDWRNGPAKAVPVAIPVESAPTPAPAPQDQSYQGSILPFSRDAQGNLILSVPTALQNLGIFGDVYSGKQQVGDLTPAQTMNAAAAMTPGARFGGAQAAPTAESLAASAPPIPRPGAPTQAMQAVAQSPRFAAPEGNAFDPWQSKINPMRARTPSQKESASWANPGQTVREYDGATKLVPTSGEDPYAFQTNTIDEPRIPTGDKLTNAVPKGHKEIEVHSPKPLEVNASDLKSVDDFRNALRSTSDNTVVLHHASDLGFNADTVVIKGDGTWGEKADPISLLTTDATPVLSPKAFLTAVDYMKKNGL